MNHNEHTEPRIYELGYHLVPTLSEEQIGGASKAVRGMIEGISKDIISEEAPVFINLAYQVVKTIDHKNKRFDDAYFGFIKFEASPENIAKLEEKLKKDGNVLRYLIVKTLRENTFISKKFPSCNAKNREEEAVAEEIASSTTEDIKTETDGEKEAKVPFDDMDKAIDKLVA